MIVTPDWQTVVPWQWAQANLEWTSVDNTEQQVQETQQVEQQPEWEVKTQASSQQQVEQQPQEEQWWRFTSKYEEILSSLWQSKLEEVYANYEKINEILNNPEELSQLTKEEVVDLVKRKSEYESFIREIEPLIEAQKRAEYERVIWKFDEPIKQTIEEIFGSDLWPEELQVIDTLMERLDNYYKNKYGSQWGWQVPQQQAEANLGEVVKKESPRINNQEDITELLKHPDPKIREAAMQKFDAFLDKYANQYT